MRAREMIILSSFSVHRQWWKFFQHGISVYVDRTILLIIEMYVIRVIVVNIYWLCFNTENKLTIMGAINNTGKNGDWEMEIHITPPRMTWLFIQKRKLQHRWTITIFLLINYQIPYLDDRALCWRSVIACTTHVHTHTHTLHLPLTWHPICHTYLQSVSLYSFYVQR